jgi:mannitol/fructose-specific phosphotransferase system IIA component (Ntr-type)
VYLADLLSVDDVVFGLRASDIAASAARLLEQTLPRRGFSPSDVARLVGAVVAREREAPTRCGTIAIPHARDSKVESFVISIGINPDGVVDGFPALRVIFAFLSPDTKRNEHLALLAALARLARDQSTIDAIATATNAKAVIDTIRARPE